MQITELLITCYDGEKPVFAVNLESDVATMVFIQADETGDLSVQSQVRLLAGELLDRYPRIDVLV